MNDYEQKKQDRIDRYRALATKARGESAGLREKSDATTKNIPFGQPVLVGHHSEKADRARRERAYNQMGRSVEAADKADYYDARAEAAENSTAISGDDPEAIAKLQEKLAGLQEMQERMKAVNAHHRKHGTCKGFPGMSDEAAAKLDANAEGGYSFEKKPYPGFSLSNNNANINNVKKRIEQLSRNAETGFSGWEFDGGEAVANKGLNRLQVFFDGKPEESQRAALKAGGFKWAPSEGAWQRQLNSNAIFAADRLDFLKPLDGRSIREHQPPAPRRDGGAR